MDFAQRRSEFTRMGREFVANSQQMRRAAAGKTKHAVSVSQQQMAQAAEMIRRSMVLLARHEQRVIDAQSAQDSYEDNPDPPPCSTPPACPSRSPSTHPQG